MVMGGAGAGGGRRVLVTGARGYLGSVLVPMLLERGHSVVAFDRQSCAGGAAAAGADPKLTTWVGDLADPDPAALVDVDLVISLAAAANAPDTAGTDRSADSDAVVRLARLARLSGVPRFLFASSCSVYGVTPSLADESSPLAPLTGYARAKAEAEQRLAALAAAEFQVVALRLATLFGASPRFRTDLILHRMVASALRDGYVESPAVAARRPLLHVRDAAEAWLHCFRLPPPHRGGALTLNVVGHNVTTTSLAALVADRLGVRARTVGVGWDRRSYWASNQRFQRLTGKRAWRGVSEGIDEIRRLLGEGLPAGGPHRPARPPAPALPAPDRRSRTTEAPQ